MTGSPGATVRPYLVDGTYELFRQYFGQSRRGGTRPLSAVQGVVASVLSILSSGATHVAVATDHVIESFRNELWPSYKDSSGVAPELLAQFTPLEEALEALGVRVFAMTELEADDALATAAAVADDDPRVVQVVICTPDKDLAQCVRGERVVQLDRRTGVLSDEQGVIEKFGVSPASIPHWLALVGDSADGFPGLPGWGKRSAALVLAHYGQIGEIPAKARDWPAELQRSVRGADKLAATLEANREAAELFLRLATLVVEPAVLTNVDELEWHGPTAEFASWAERLDSPGLVARAEALHS